MAVSVFNSVQYVCIFVWADWVWSDYYFFILDTPLSW